MNFALHVKNPNAVFRSEGFTFLLLFRKLIYETRMIMWKEIVYSDLLSEKEAKMTSYKCQCKDRIECVNDIRGEVGLYSC